LVVGGKAGPPLKPWRKISSPFDGFTFSPDGKRYAYVAAGWFAIPALKVKDSLYFRKEPLSPAALAEGVPVVVSIDGSAVIVDGQRTGAGGMPPEGDLEFEAGKTLQQEKARFVTGAYLFSEPVFSPDGSRVAFAEVEFKGTKGFSLAPEYAGRVYVEDKPGPAYTVRGGTGQPILEANGFPIIVRGLYPAWAGVSAPVFSPDSRHVAYAARRAKDDYFIMLDGAPQPGPRLEWFLGGPVFSPDSQHVACVGHAEGQTVVVLDGTITARLPGTKDDFAELLTFSPDGHRLAFVTGTAEPAYWTGENMRARRRVVVDGVPGRQYDATSFERLVFSADSRHVAYIVYAHGPFTFPPKAVAVLDGQESRIYDVVYPKTLRFSGADCVSYVAIDEERAIFRVTQTAR
jgi:hypothetical protein